MNSVCFAVRPLFDQLLTVLHIEHPRTGSGDQRAKTDNQSHQDVDCAHAGKDHLGIVQPGRYADDVSDALAGGPNTQAQFDAMVCFHNNTGAIRRATLTRLHRAGDYSGALLEFSRWNRAGDRVMKGLVRRRVAEARLYSGG